MSVEDDIIRKIDLQRLCKREINRVFKLVKRKDFHERLDLQDELALLLRGTNLKFKTLKLKSLHEEGRIEDLMKLLSVLAKSYGSMYDKKEGRSSLPGSSAENPLHVAGSMNIKAIKDAIKRDQET